MVAYPVGYDKIIVSWHQPLATALGHIFRYRLLASRYGYPVNENDGDILIDSEVYPASAYLDTSVRPGEYKYYGFYVAVDDESQEWVRAGVTGCLAVRDFGASDWLWENMPLFFRTLPDGSDLPEDINGKSDLRKFIEVLGWGLNTLRTQYYTMSHYVNDPWHIQYRELLNMSDQFGVEFSPEVEAYTIRKAVYNQAITCRERGTLPGIRHEISLRTGFDADVQMGHNILLEDDQGQFLSPIFIPYDDNTTYSEGEIVYVGVHFLGVIFDPRVNWWGSGDWDGHGYWYRCAVEGTIGIAPPGDGTSSANWTVILDADDIVYTQFNTLTNGIGTWEVVDPGDSAGIAPFGYLTQGLGVNIPGGGSGYNAWNSLRLRNLSMGTKTLMVRSVSRSAPDTGQIPDPSFEAGTTIMTSGGRRTNYSWVPGGWPDVCVSGEDGTAVRECEFWTASGAVIRRTKQQAHTGSYSLFVDSDSATVVGSPFIPVTPSQSLSSSIYVFAASTITSPGVRCIVRWYDANGAYLSQSSGTASVPSVNTWTQKTCSASAPADAAFASIGIDMTAATEGDDIYIDDVFPGAAQPADSVYPPEQIQAIRDGLPVPWTRNNQAWDVDTEYATNDMVHYRGQSFIALRASTGAVPPTNNVATPEWSPLSFERRVRLAVSGNTSQNLTASGDQTAAVTPFVEWFDRWGNLISRIFARNPNSDGTYARPDQLAFDSFTTFSAPGTSDFSGTVDLGPWSASFYNNETLSGSPVVTRTDTNIDFTWNCASPATGVNDVGWSGKWITSFTAPVTGVYTFGVTSSDGSRVIVDGTTVIDNWETQSSTHKTGTISLTNGDTITVEVDYYKSADTGGTIGFSTYTDDYDEDGSQFAGWQFTGGNPIHGLVTQQQGPLRPCFPGALVTAEAWVIYRNGFAAAWFIWYDKDGKIIGSSIGPYGNPVFPGADENVPIGLVSAVVGVEDTAPPGTAYVALVIGSNGLNGGVNTMRLDRASTYVTTSVPVGWTPAPGKNPPKAPAQTQAHVTQTTLITWTRWVYTGFEVTVKNTIMTVQQLAAPLASGLSLDETTWRYSVTNAIGPSLQGRYTDDRTHNWSCPAGDMIQGGYRDGAAWATDPTVRSVALLTGTSDGQIGVTFRTDAPEGSVQGMVFRYSSDANYWRADRTTLKKKVSGSWASAGTYSTPFSDDDRMVIQLNGNAITVLRNNVIVLTVTDSFNVTANEHGMEYQP